VCAVISLAIHGISRNPYRNDIDMKISRRSIVAAWLLGCTLAAAQPFAGHAQSEDLSVGLTLPNEGETFYAGPSSLLYMIPIRGWVKSVSFPIDQLSVEIEIYQDSTLAASLAIAPDSEGNFESFAKVNPGAYSQEFAAEFIPCGDVCHFNPSTQFQKTDWVPDLDLPPGPMRLVVTATDPAGRVASDQRNITVDRSAYAIVPVQIVLEAASPFPIENIPITATSWLYMWRSRFATGATDAGGLAHVRVEALSQAPTSLRFQIKPVVVDGVYYEGITPVDIVLPASAISGPLVTIKVRATLGSIHGQVHGDFPYSRLQIWAIHLPEGNAMTTSVTQDGSFVFENVAIGEYMITSDPDILAAHRFATKNVTVDLSQSVTGYVDLDLLPLENQSVQGDITDTKGNRLPFAWVSFEDQDIVEEVMPGSGQYTLSGLTAQNAILVAYAPGYYSQVRVADLTIEPDAGLDFKLVRRPETRSLPWGDGEIIVSPETRISLSGQNIFLERGWLWGQNHDDDSVTIQSGQIRLNLSNGKFALEAIPGQPAWFYLFEGNGTVSSEVGSRVFHIQAGQMVALDGDSQFSVVPYDPVVVKIMRSDVQLSVPMVLQPTITAQITNRLALIGIDMAKMVTFITYMAIIISIILLPSIALNRLIHKRKKSTDNMRIINGRE
jgi:hypothetical protein